MTRNDYITLLADTHKAINQLAEKSYGFGRRTVTNELALPTYEDYYSALKAAHSKIEEIEKLTWVYFE